MERLRQTFRPHQFEPDEHYIDLYHVYDNLSRTPFRHGVGIECEDPDEYVMNAWHVITPLAMRHHLDWRNRNRTQFVSFYDNLADALHEQQRRLTQPFVRHAGRRRAPSVQIAHVRIPRGTNVWAFSRQEMLDMIGTFGHVARMEMFRMSGVSEWFVWGVVPETLVQNRSAL